MPVPLSAETERRVAALFEGAARVEAADLLVAHCGDNLPFNQAADARSLERIRFAVLKLSHGSLASLREAVAAAQIDSRDILMAAGFGQDVDAHQAWFPGDSS